MISNEKKTAIISIYGTVHCVVDFCCAAIIYYYVNKVDISFLLQLVLIYNILAFGLQSVFGYIQDKIHKPDIFAIFGCIILILGIFLYKNPIASTILLGTGNALFHTGGGVIALETGNGRANLPGIFVAPGAIGLFLGMFWSKTVSINNLFLIILPLISIIFMALVKPEKDEQVIYTNKSSTPVYLIIVLLIFSSVCIRSIAGLSYEFTGKDNLLLLISYILAIAFGKALGGIFADRFGFFNTALTGLLLAIPLLKFGNIPQLAILGMFFFNLTMPVTVTALANMMPDYKGLAFGLTTLALLAGALPVIILPYVSDFKITQSFLFFGLLIISVIISAISLKLYEKLFNRP